jgi:hypothetical protein
MIGDTQLYKQQDYLIRLLTTIRGDTQQMGRHGRINRQQGDLISLLLFFENKGTRLTTEFNIKTHNVSRWFMSEGLIIYSRPKCVAYARQQQIGLIHFAEQSWGSTFSIKSREVMESFEQVSQTLCNKSQSYLSKDTSV